MRHYSEILTVDPGKRFGKPTIRGMRITVYDVLNWLSFGMTYQESCKTSGIDPRGHFCLFSLCCR